MDIEKFKQLLAEGKEQEAQEMLEGFLAESVMPQEKAQVMIELASAHMVAQNTINEEHVRVLKNAIAELSDMEKDHNDITDSLELLKTRKQLE